MSSRKPRILYNSEKIHQHAFKDGGEVFWKEGFLKKELILQSSKRSIMKSLTSHFLNFTVKELEPTLSVSEYLRLLSKRYEDLLIDFKTKK